MSYFFLNRCSNCFKCPCCFQTLSTRAGHVPLRVIPIEGEDSKDIKTTPKKVYYLFCSLCRWTSRDAGIPDQSGGMFIQNIIIYNIFISYIYIYK